MSEIGLYGRGVTTYFGEQLRTRIFVFAVVVFGIRSRSGVSPYDEISFYGLHERQRVDFDGPSVPLTQLTGLWVPLQVTFDLVSIEELEGVAAASAESAGNVVELHLKLLDLIDASDQFAEQERNRGAGGGGRSRRRRRGVGR